MADYKVQISYDDKGADKKLTELDKKLKGVAKEHKINISFPDVGKLNKSLQETAKYAGVAVQAFKALTPVGRQFAELEESAAVLGGTLKTVGTGLVGLSRYANPVRGISDGFTVATASANALVASTAQIGFAIFGVTQSINVLKAAFGGLFNDTVGREVRLRETLLQTATTLAGTNRVLLEGVEIEDPTQKLKALEKPINESIERIREKSLEIAGTTSEAVIQTFNIVASQIGSFGGTLRDAEQLATQFAGALGTLGMSDPMYARQEVGSILMGYVDNNSVLAKTLGITNEEIQKAKQSAGGLVAYLNEKLKVFEAGQQTAAKGFRGITSNLQELSDEMKRAFGAQLLDPILKRLDAFYSAVSGKDTMKQLLQTARAFGQFVGSTANSAIGIAGRSSIFQGLDDNALNTLLSKVQTTFAKIAEYIQSELARIAPSIQRTIDSVVSAVVVLGKALGETAAVLARVKLDQFAVQLQILSSLAPAIVAAANAYSFYLETVRDILNTPIGRYLNELNATFQVLKQTGVTGIVPLLFAIDTLRKGVPALIASLKGIGDAIGAGFGRAAAFVSGVITKITAAVTTGVATAVTAVTTGIARITAAVAQLLARLSIALNALSTKLALGGGAGAGLAAPIAAAAKAVDGLAVAFERAEQQATEFGVKARAAMTQVQTSAAGAATQVNTLGTNLKNGAANGAKAAGGAMMGFAGSIIAATAKMALWTAAITLVLDGLRRISEWWESEQQDQRAAMAVDRLKNGLLDTADAARAAGRELDPVTKALLDADKSELDTKIDKITKKILNLNTELKKLDTKGLSTATTNPSLLLMGGELDAQLAQLDKTGASKQADAIRKAIEQLKKEQKELVELRKRADGSTDASGDPQLAARERRDQIQALADFEKQTRRAIEDEVYNYRRQIQSQEIQLWRQQGELRIDQIDAANRRLIEGSQAEARESLAALNNWITTKRKGELDIEARRKEAQLAAADLERALGRFRMNLEQQVAELRKRINQYDIQILDKRIKGEQLIANIRNGAIVWEVQSAGGAGGTGPVTDPTSAAAIAKATQATADLTGITNMCARAVKRFMESVGIAANVMDDSALSAQRMGRVMTDWSQLRPGDIVARGRVGDPEHVGVYTGGQNVFHQSSQAGLKTGNFPHLGYFKERGYFIRPYASSQFTGPATGGSPMAGYLRRLAELETDGNPRPNAQGSGAQGWFQTKNAFHAEALAASGGRNSRSANYPEAAAAVEAWIKKHRPEAYAAILAGQYDKADAILRQGTWPSLPGGSQARDAAAQERARRFLTAGGGATPSAAPGTAGAAGIGSIGGAPQAPDVTLNISTDELENVISRLKEMNKLLLDAEERARIFQNEENFQGFVKSLDKTGDQLQTLKNSLQDKKTELDVVTAALRDGVTDQRLIEIDMQSATAVNLMQRIRDASLEFLGSAQGMKPEERARATQAVLDAFNKNISNLGAIRTAQQALLDVERDRAAAQQTITDNIQIQAQLLQDTFSMRTEAAKAALGERDFAGRRRLDANQAIYGRYMELSEGGTRDLTAEQQANLENFAARTLASAEAMAKLEEELANFGDRLALAREAASTITDGFRGFAASILKGGDIKEAASEMMQGIAGRFIDMFVDYAFKPLEQMLEKQFRELFGVDDAENANTNALQQLTISVDALRVAISSPAPGGALTGLHPEDAEMLGLLDGADETAGAFDELDAALGEMPSAAEQATNALQNTLGGITTLATGAMAIFAGISQMGKGGTYNTLTGLASIFGGLGAVFGGGFGGFFAEGGNFAAHKPIVVGEKGPELIFPNYSGAVVPNTQVSAALRGTRSRLEAGDDPLSTSPEGGSFASAATIRLETTTINNVEYATVDQLQKSHDRAIKMGRSLTLHDIQKSAKVRRRLGV